VDEATIRILLVSQGGTGAVQSAIAPSSVPPSTSFRSSYAPAPPAPSYSTVPPRPRQARPDEEPAMDMAKLGADTQASQKMIAGMSAAAKSAEDFAASLKYTDPLMSKLGTSASRASEEMIAGMSAAAREANAIVAELLTAEVFDPRSKAKKAAADRLEREKFQKDVDQEYAALKPPAPPKKAFDDLLESAESMRGILGGTFGRLAGIALDVTAKARAATGAAAEGAAGTAGGFAGAASAAAPIMLAVQAALAADSVVKSNITGAVQGAGAVANFATSPDDNPSSAIKGVGAAVSDLGNKIPFVGQQLVFLGESAKVAGGLMDNFNRLADRYGDYNPQIAQAQAMAEVRKVLGDMQRARTYGGELSEFVRVQSEFAQKFEDLKVALGVKILPILTGILNAINTIIGQISDQEDDNLDPTSILLRATDVALAQEGATIPLSAPADVIGGV
jgi:hypothetical protein